MKHEDYSFAVEPVMLYLYTQLWKIVNITTVDDFYHTFQRLCRQLVEVGEAICEEKQKEGKR